MSLWARDGLRHRLWRTSCPGAGEFEAPPYLCIKEKPNVLSTFSGPAAAGPGPQPQKGLLSPGRQTELRALAGLPLCGKARRAPSGRTELRALEGQPLCGRRSISWVTHTRAPEAETRGIPTLVWLRCIL